VPIALLLGAAYYAFFWGMKGATPGKRMVGLAVAAEDGTTPIGMSRATLRVLGYLASGLLLGIGFLMIAFGGTALHDRIAGTRVVRRGMVG
jgi:Predicted membrane protein/domain